MTKVSVIGDGGWGTTLALLLHSKGVDTTLWSAFSEYSEYLKKKRENTKFLKGIPLPKDLKITSDVAQTSEAAFAFFAVPCKYLREVAKRFADAKFSHIISTVKGIENDTLKRPSEILSEFFKGNLSALSGPSIAIEVARKIPTTIVAASIGNNKRILQDLLTTDHFRIYTSNDIIGVEMGGALKNIIAIASGISDGMGFGTNTKAAILTRGLVEITRLGVKMGAQGSTFRGLSGIGDLATTCMSPYSRNRWFGEEIGRGRNIKDILAETEMVVEGLSTSRSAYELARRYDVEMPITEKVYEVLYEGKSPKLAVRELMTREPKDEDWE